MVNKAEGIFTKQIENGKKKSFYLIAVVLKLDCASGSPGVGNGNALRILAWRIAWTEEPGGLQSVGSQGVGHD